METSSEIPTTQPTTTVQGAGVGVRFVATVIDGFAFLLIMIVLGMFIGESEVAEGSANVSLDGGPAIIYFLVVMAYYIIGEGKWGQTLGKKAMGLRVVNESGGPVSYGQATGRSFARIIDGLFFYLVAAISVWVTDDNRRLGDIWASTYVISDR